MSAGTATICYSLAASSSRVLLASALFGLMVPSPAPVSRVPKETLPTEAEKKTGANSLNELQKNILNEAEFVVLGCFIYVLWPCFLISSEEKYNRRRDGIL